MMQVLQLFGAILILIAFSLSQMRKLDPHSQPYLILNTIGAGILAVLAAIESMGIPSAGRSLDDCLAVGLGEDMDETNRFFCRSKRLVQFELMPT